MEKINDPLWKRVVRFVVCMAAIGPTLLFCLIALEMEKRRLKREVVVK